MYWNNNPFKFYFFLTLFFGLQSCVQSTCADETFDNQSFTTETALWKPYTNMDTLVLVDKSGQEYKYIKTHKLTSIRPYIFDEDCNEKTRTISYNGDYELASFQGPNQTQISVAYFVTFLDEESQFIERNIIDLVGVSIFDASVTPNRVISRLTFISSNRGGNIDPVEYNQRSSVSKPSVELFNRNFSNVIEQLEYKTTPIIVNQDYGVLSFSDSKGVKLVFSRFITP